MYENVTSTMIEQAKALLGSGCNESGITFLLQSIESKTRKYCRLEELSEGLRTIVVEIAVSRYRNQLPGTAEINQTVSSISDNGQSVSYAKPNSEILPSTGFTQSEMQMLNEYRKAW